MIDGLPQCFLVTVNPSVIYLLNSLAGFSVSSREYLIKSSNSTTLDPYIFLLPAQDTLLRLVVIFLVVLAYFLEF